MKRETNSSSREEGVGGNQADRGCGGMSEHELVVGSPGIHADGEAGVVEARGRQEAPIQL